MIGIWQDVRFGVRMLLKHRLATLICVVALGLGIGANAAMFSMAEGFLLHPVPFENPDRLIALVDSRPEQSVEMNSVAPATFFDWKKEAQSFAKLTFYAWSENNLTGDREPQKIQSFLVAANFFQTIGIQPQLGRAFLPEEEEAGKDQEIILGHALWEQRYASDPNIVGKTIKVDGLSVTVVGVMRKGFDFPMPAEAWMPLGLDAKARQDRTRRWLFVLGKMKDGVSFEQASAEMKAITARQADAYPDANKGWTLRPMPLRQFVTGNLTRQYTILLLGAVGFVLLIACADVANVQFARITGRTNELAVRTALGGSKRRVVRQLLVESILLSLCGAALGLLFGEWGVAMILSHMPPDVAKYVAGWKTISLDSGAFLFTLGVAVASGILSGIAPALLSSRTNINETLKEGGRGGSVGRARHRLRGALVVAEVALALVLLVGAGLLVRSFQGLLNINESYHPETLLTMNVTLPHPQYEKAAARLNFHEQMWQQLASLSGVQTAALVSHVPYSEGGGIGEDNIAIEGRAPGKRGEIVSAIIETATPNYFGLMNIALRDGRLLSESDGAKTQPVAVVSASLVRRYFPAGENPLGKKIQIGNTGGQGSADHPWMTIVGVVSDVHYSWINKEDQPTLYRSFRQSPPYFTTVVLRTQGHPSSLFLRRELKLLRSIQICRCTTSSRWIR